MKVSDVSLRHPINYQCPTCGSQPGEKCVAIPNMKSMFRKYHVTREAVARKARPSEMRKYG